MPAYRSSAEAEIREPVVARLREMIPGCRIIHEIQCSTHGPNRMDVAAIGETQIAVVEIKSAKDKLDRLPAQIASMRRVTDRVYAALHEKFLAPLGPLGVTTPTEANRATVWVYPKRDRDGHVDCKSEWSEGRAWGAKPKLCLPSTAIEMLWRGELQAICAGLGKKAVTRLNMDEAIDVIRWRLTGEEQTRVVCATLRARRCPEADPEILTERIAA